MYGMMYSPEHHPHHHPHHHHHHHAHSAHSAAKMMMNSKPLGSPSGQSPNCFSGRYSPTYRVPDQMRDPMRRCMTNPPPELFGLNDGSLLSRASAADLVVEMKHPAVSCTTSLPSPTSGGVGSGGFHIKTDMMYTTGIPVSGVSSGGSSIGGGSLSLNSRIHQMDHMSGLEMLGSPHSTGGGSTGSAGGPAIDPVSIAMSATPTPLPPSSMSSSGVDHHSQLAAMGMYSHPSSMMSPHPPIGHHHAHHHTTSVPMQDVDADPSPFISRELEAFAERFKQRRIKLGVTQCDVGKALANLKLPGVGALSQSTICRFESLTLSHNNMIALKPVLSAWLDEAEAAKRDPDGCHGVLPPGEKKRKRTSIAAPEKRSLEAYFAVQPRPSGEKIAAIAEKLDLKKNVVRVWFCNQRQKQKRMKFAAQGGL